MLRTRSAAVSADNLSSRARNALKELASKEIGVVLFRFQAHDLGRDVFQCPQQLAAALGQKHRVGPRHLHINLARFESVRMRGLQPSAVIRYFNRRPPVVVRVLRNAAIF